MKSFTYDKANQLVTSTTGDKVTNYAYDAAGRLVKEGSVASGFKTYSYGYLDKILEVQENGEQIAAFDYHINGQIASATYADKTENFLWDGLALIQRSVRPTAELPAFGTGSRITNFINEPAITGGNPILSSKGDVMFNDLLGTTLVVKSGEQVNQVNMTAFGEPVRPAANGDAAKNQDAFFTGKPHIGELGYAFLFRNYRPDQGKWQTQDPIATALLMPDGENLKVQSEFLAMLGYPDGWNNLAYGNNNVFSGVDYQGTEWALVNTTGSLPSRHEINDLPDTPGSYTSPAGLIRHSVTEIFRSWGSPTVTGTAPSNPTNGMTYTSTETYSITISTYTYTYWEDPISSSKVGGNQNVDVTVTTATTTIIKTYTYTE